ncbi:MAG TPA: leucyl/phenylalanyl-tRNA--protein transferase [Puia sp.]|nr:leucyl/phenylalanyl-tRNA--protein transferase [Puia sp.]
MIFPPQEEAGPDGLLAVGGDLSVQRLLLAYRHGIFPWYEGKHILWWCPDPRFVLFPAEIRESKSMRQLIRRNTWEFRINSDFSQVIRQCKTVSRRGQESTWITDEVREAYTRLHEAGYAHSAEVWQGVDLIGGLYGVRLGKVFFGESMFSLVSNASKFAFILYVRQLMEDDVRLIDCQVYTDHLATLGARMIPRVEFLRQLDEWIS